MPASPHSGAAAGRRRSRGRARSAGTEALPVVPAMLVPLRPVERPPRAAAREATLVGLAAAYAAWNAHDLDAVLGFFAADATVRQRGCALPDEIGNAQARLVQAMWAVRAACLAAALGVAALAGCAPPVAHDAAGTAPLLYVANGGDQTITRLDERTGRAVGPPLPAGPLPDQVVPGPGGTLLVRSATGTPERTSGLTHVAPAGGRANPWVARPVPLEPGAREVQLAGDAAAGGRLAAVAYRAPDPATGRLRCRVALVDLGSGAVQEPRTVGLCASRGQIAGLALDAGPGNPDGPVAYLVVWTAPDPAADWRDLATDSDWRDLGGTWLAAIRLDTGAAGAVRPLARPAIRLSRAPAPGQTGWRLYTLETLGGADEAAWLVGYNPYTLDPEREYLLDATATRVGIAPDGDHAYVLTYRGLAVVDLVTGAQRLLASLPGPSTGLAVTAARVYVPNPFGSELWAVDRRTRALVRTIPVGPHPLAVAAAP